ncbi:MAG: hypothetical protein FH756_19805 [Firmicutes bacterium]|nr:hypothetical protein [Bacillota bacterium]
MTRKRGAPYALGQAVIMATVLLLLYSYFYYAYYNAGPYLLSPFSTQIWISNTLLSVMTILSGILIELSRFWGWIIQYRVKQELLIIQGIPSGMLSFIPSTVWVKYFGTGYPFNFLADPAVSGAAGIWFGIILMRSLVEKKRLKEEEPSNAKEHSR